MIEPVGGFDGKHDAGHASLLVVHRQIDQGRDPRVMVAHDEVQFGDEDGVDGLRLGQIELVGNRRFPVAHTAKLAHLPRPWQLPGARA